MRGVNLTWRVLFSLHTKKPETRRISERFLPDYLRMSSSDNTRKCGLITRANVRNVHRSSSVPRDPGGHNDSEHADYFCESNCPERRPSTIDDELQVKHLLKETLAFKETGVSSWIVENKVKNLCAAYKYLLKPHRDGFLKDLACNYAVNHQLVAAAAKNLCGVQRQSSQMEGVCDQRTLVKGEERLKNLLTPLYTWLFIHIGRLEKGVKFLVDMRTDVLILISEMDVTDPALVLMQQLNTNLREMLSLWFTVGFLNLERVTWRSPCEMLQKISEYEAVHPMRSWTDLKRRVGLYRRCFVYTHSSMPDEPLVVLHTALSDEIASSMKGIVTATSRMSVDVTACPGLVVESQTEDPTCVKAAIFYSITSTQRGLQGIELGNYLIKRVVKELQAEFPLVNKFSSLSPIPTFHFWLMDKIKGAEKTLVGGNSDLLTSEECEALQTYLKKDDLWAELKRLLKTNGWVQDSVLASMLEKPLMRLCVRYLYLEKRRGFALDNVANFHLRNGATMWRVNWHADWSPRGLSNSCGIMVNYRYFLDNTEFNSQTYLEKHIIAASQDVQQLATQAANLMEKFNSKI